LAGFIHHCLDGVDWYVKIIIPDHYLCKTRLNCHQITVRTGKFLLLKERIFIRMKNDAWHYPPPTDTDIIRINYLQLLTYKEAKCLRKVGSKSVTSTVRAVSFVSAPARRRSWN
jgi:hypothetical protein